MSSNPYESPKARIRRTRPRLMPHHVGAIALVAVIVAIMVMGILAKMFNPALNAAREHNRLNPKQTMETPADETGEPNAPVQTEAK